MPCEASPAADGDGAQTYQLWRADKSCTHGDWGAPRGQHRSLAEAMTAARHPDFGAWQTATGLPGLLFSGGAAPPSLGQLAAPGTPAWTIGHPGVAREFAEACPPEVRAERIWSALDEPIITAVLAVTQNLRAPWPLPLLAACDAGGRLAARYATGVRGALLTGPDVFTVVHDAYRDAHAGHQVPPDVIGEVTRALMAELASAGIRLVACQMVPAASDDPRQPRHVVPAART